MGFEEGFICASAGRCAASPLHCADPPLPGDPHGDLCSSFSFDVLCGREHNVAVCKGWAGRIAILIISVIPALWWFSSFAAQIFVVFGLTPEVGGVMAIIGLLMGMMLPVFD